MDCHAIGFAALGSLRARMQKSAAKVVAKVRGMAIAEPCRSISENGTSSHKKVRDDMSTRTAAFVVAIASLVLAAILQIAPAPVYAHDFGGGTTGGSGDPPPPPPPPCDSPCGCQGPGGEGGGGGAGGPPSRSSDPVSYWNGSESLTETDLKIGTVLPIVISRKYDSLSTYDSPIGFGWAFMHDRRLFEYPDGSILVRYGCGTRDRYVPSGGTYVSPTGGMLGHLVHNPDGTWELTYLNGTRDRFDSLGRLTTFLDVRGNQNEFTYDAAGKLPLTGTSKSSATPGQPMVVAYHHRLTRIDERGADGALTGRYVTFAYDATTGRVVSATANDGRSVSYSHDVTAGLTKGNLVQVVGLQGIVRRYAYTDSNDEHNLTSITEATGRTAIVNTYDDQDRVIRQDEGTRRIEFNYQVPLTRTVITRTVRDQNGLNPYTAVTILEFDPTGRITRITDPLGHQQRYIYNAAKLPERRETWENSGGTLTLLQAMDWTYDSAGHKASESVTLDSGEVITRSWTYDHDFVASEQVVSSAAPAKIFRTEYTFFRDGNGRPMNVEQIRRRKDDGSFQTTSYTYDARNRPLTTTLPDGVMIVHEYTGEFLTKRSFEVGGVAIAQLTRRFEYDGEGNLIKEWDARNNLKQRGYDDLGRPVSVTNALSEQYLYTFSDDLLTLVERGHTAAEGEGQVTKLNYDTRGRLISQQRKDNGGAFQTFETYELDSEGRRLSVTDALNRKTKYAYDLLGRLASMTDPLNKVTQYAYDAAGNLILITDALGRQVRREYDDLNRRTAIVELGAVPNPRTSLAYDAANNLIAHVDAEDHTTSYEYDALSRNTRITQPMGQFLQYVYDERDRVDYLVNARGNKLDFTYAPWGPIVLEQQFATSSSASPTRSVSYGYDDDGHVLTVSDDGVQPGLMYSFTYDALGRRYDETIKYLPGGDRVLQHRYDRYGNRRELTLQDGTAISSTYTFDKLNRIGAANLAGASITLGYYANDNRQSVVLPGGVTRSYTYEGNGPIDAVTVTGTLGQIAQYSYAYDDVTNIDSATDADGLHDFTYDGLNRLTAATRPAAAGLPNESYTYDKVGNREDPVNASLYAYDSNNRVTASAGLTYTSDPDGNVLTRSDGVSYTHDYRNRLVQYGAGSITGSYVVDTIGRRIRKTVNGTTTWYLWAGTRLLAEYDGAGVRQARYAYVGEDFTPTQYQNVNGTYYVHGDNLETPRILTDGAGSVVWRARYDSFGKAAVESDPDGNSVPIVFNFRLRGQYFDAESATHYNRYRNYDPGIGRYIEADPIGFGGGNNIYTYGANNPLRFSDPEGLAIYRWPPNNYGDIPPPGSGCEQAVVRHGYIVGWIPCDFDPPPCPPQEPPPGPGESGSGDTGPSMPPPPNVGSETPGKGPQSAEPPIPTWSSPGECLYHCTREALSETWHHLAYVDGGTFLGIAALEHLGVLSAGAAMSIGVPIAVGGIALAGGYALGSMLVCGHECAAE